MKPKTEELLYFLLWTAGQMMRPTFRNLTESYESWAYRNGFLRQIQRLEAGRLIERDPRRPDARVYRLTQQGRRHALGGRDPVAQWGRGWDGRWRMILFDIPVRNNTWRRQLRRYLLKRGFGCLQDSVWITPDALDQERKWLAREKIDVESLILLEAHPCAGESNADLVAGAWHFTRINRRYTQYLRVLESCPESPIRDETSARALRRWAALEREAWLSAAESDPFLPDALLPSDYLGKKAWRRRIKVLSAVAHRLRDFGL